MSLRSICSKHCSVVGRWWRKSWRLIEADVGVKLIHLQVINSASDRHFRTLRRNWKPCSAKRKYPPIDSSFQGKLVVIIINEAREDCCYRDRNEKSDQWGAAMCCCDYRPLKTQQMNRKKNKKLIVIDTLPQLFNYIKK